MTDPLPNTAQSRGDAICPVCRGAVCANTVPDRRAQAVGLVVHHLQRLLKNPTHSDTIARRLLPVHRPYIEDALAMIADAGQLGQGSDGVRLVKPPPVPGPPPQDGLFDEPPRAKRKLL